MNEVNRPRKPLIVFYIVFLLLLFLFNSLIAPMIAEQEIKEVDYGTFMTMTEKKQIGKVQVETNKIMFTNKDGSLPDDETEATCALVPSLSTTMPSQ